MHDFSFSCEAHARVEGGAIQICQTSKGVIFPSRAELSCGAHDRGGGGIQIFPASKGVILLVAY